MKKYIVDCDIDWDFSEEETVPLLPLTLHHYEVIAEDEKDLSHKIVEQLTEEYGYCINGVAYDILLEVNENDVH